MALTKQDVVDLIEVVLSGSVQVRTATQILENGQILSSSYHRHVIAPGESYSGEDPRVQTVCKAVHTPAVIKAYKDAIAATEANMGA